MDLREEKIPTSLLKTRRGIDSNKAVGLSLAVAGVLWLGWLGNELRYTTQNNATSSNYSTSYNISLPDPFLHLYKEGERPIWE